ncbi:hypothetical protein [Mycobacterium sp.]|uniref:hypothetical protein n=1 Tax=Mycobacterium sp. TaxID=1785 RepID=UPI003BA8AE13
MGDEPDYLKPVEARYVNVPADAPPGMCHAPARLAVVDEYLSVAPDEPVNPQSATASGDYVNTGNPDAHYSAIDPDYENTGQVLAERLDLQRTGELAAQGSGELVGEPDYLKPVEARYVDMSANSPAGLRRAPASRLVGLGDESPYVGPDEPVNPQSATASGDYVNTGNPDAHYSAIDPDPDYASIDDINRSRDYSDTDSDADYVTLRKPAPGYVTLRDETPYLWDHRSDLGFGWQPWGEDDVETPESDSDGGVLGLV